MFDRLRLLNWSLRKMRQPIYGRGLILDVGSGGNPHPFADVLLEKYLDNTHRLRAITVDRPTVLADAGKMPFRDNSFGYSFAFHVLEHMHNPDQMLNELERVSESGYIETPNALYERIHPYDVHLLEIFELNGVLHIHKKGAAMGDDFIGTLKILDTDKEWRRFFGRHPRFFHVCYKWRGKIEYKILNPETSTEWFDDPETLQDVEPTEFEAVAETSLRARLIGLIRKTRKVSFSLDDLLACPECRSDLSHQGEVYSCTLLECGLSYAAHPVPDFNNPVQP